MIDIINSHLPSHIIDLIFCKLPIPSLAICRLVCKSWNNLILTTGKYAPNSTFFFGLDITHNKFLCIDFDSKSLEESKSCIVGSFIFQPRFSTFKFVNSCNGLFCFVDKGWKRNKDDCALILNPTTNEYIQIPMAAGFNFRYYDFGFGFSPNTKQYKIVRFPTTMISNTSSVAADIFAIGTSSSTSCEKWSINVSILPFLNDGFNSVYLNGCIYWNGHFATERDTNVLLRFDVEGDKFQKISCPQSREIRSNKSFTSHIQVLNDNHLYLSSYRFKPFRFCVWRMEQDYSWMEEFVVHLNLVPQSPQGTMDLHDYSLYYLVTSKNHFQLIKVFEDGNILCLLPGRNLILYDSKTSRIEELDHKLHEGADKEKLYIYETGSFNFSPLRKILGA